MVKTAFLTILLIALYFEAMAVTYTKSSAGNYSSAAGWSPSYPGTTIGSSDLVIIDAAVTLDVDIEVEGTFTVNSGASLSGTKEIKEITSS